MTKQVLAPFSIEYQEICFTIWYEAGRPSFAKFMDILPPDQYGRRPDRNKVSKWCLAGWYLRADELDARASVAIDTRLVSDRVKMLEEQAERGARLQLLGMAYLENENKGFDSSSSALRAVIEGADLEARRRGLSELLEKVGRLTPEQLGDFVADKLARLTIGDSTDIIEADEIMPETQAVAEDETSDEQDINEENENATE
jgi:hypothetical protein